MFIDSRENTLISGGIAAFKGRRVLLLQGPLGPFFRCLGRDLQEAGAQVWKINFNGGDWLFHAAGSTMYRGTPEDWPNFLKKFLLEHGIDTILLFGDCRALHRTAHKIAASFNVEIGVFEEGYVRPNYITFERHGVNGHSLVPRIPAFYRSMPRQRVSEQIQVPYPFWYMLTWAILYYLASVLLRPVFPHYRHHRPLSLAEAWPWAKSACRKVCYKFTQRHVQDQLVGQYSGRYFLVPLQVHNDAQVHVHSSFDSIEDFIEHVVHSFACHAPHDALLVIKQHPMDRGYHDRTDLIARLAARNRVEGRLRYIHDQHLPTLLEHARGVIVLNSTVGLSALHHGTPLKVCGNALYDMEGLTFQKRLDDFWTQAPSTVVDRELYERFQSYLVKHTQLNGSFYRRLPLPGSCAGLVWSALPLSWSASPSAPFGPLSDMRTAAIGGVETDPAHEVV
jgi:capsular polysaccharide export protein